MVGAPHFLSMTTLRPRGPSVTLTASARWFTPRSRWRRASSSNSRILGIDYLNLRVGSGFGYGAQHRRAPGRQAPRPTTGGTGALLLLLDNREHVAGREHQVLLARVLHFRAAVLAVQDNVADLDVHGNALGARVVEAAGTDREDLALLGLLLRGVRDDQPGCRGLLRLKRLDHDPVLEWFENNLGGGRHDLTSPSGKG